MKNFLLTISIILFSLTAFGQITDVTESSLGGFNIKTKNGSYSAGSSNCRDCILAGFNDNFVVIVGGLCTSSSDCKNVSIYNAKGSYNGSFSICKDCKVKSVLANRIVASDKFGGTVSYDFKGNRLRD